MIKASYYALIKVPYWAARQASSGLRMYRTMRAHERLKLDELQWPGGRFSAAGARATRAEPSKMVPARHLPSYGASMSLAKSWAELLWLWATSYTEQSALYYFSRARSYLEIHEYRTA